MISRRLVIGLLGAGVLAFALCAAPVAPALSPEARNAKLDETLRGLVEGRSTPGIVVLILQNSRPVYSRSVGVREVGSAALIGENDMFRLASTTKAVTSVAAMILIEQGKIGLDDPVSRFLRVRQAAGAWARRHRGSCEQAPDAHCARWRAIGSNAEQDVQIADRFPGRTLIIFR